MRLVEVDAEQRLHEGRVAHLWRMAKQRGGNLGVENGGRHAPGVLHHDLDILAARVQHPRRVEQGRPERIHVDAG